MNPFATPAPSPTDWLNVSRRAAAARSASQAAGMDPAIARYWLAEADHLDQLAEAMAVRIALDERGAYLSLEPEISCRP